jgi:hypothetical protein
VPMINTMPNGCIVIGSVSSGRERANAFMDANAGILRVGFALSNDVQQFCESLDVWHTSKIWQYFSSTEIAAACWTLIWFCFQHCHTYFFYQAVYQ